MINNLISLSGSPTVIGKYFSCSNNKLTSLKGAPKEVGGSFYCYNNMLTTLDYLPNIPHNLVCYNNNWNKPIPYNMEFFGPRWIAPCSKSGVIISPD